MLGDRVSMTFITVNSSHKVDPKPDLVHYFPNGTLDARLVRNGKVWSGVSNRPRLNITSTPKEDGGFIVRADIYPVEPEDAGTYVATDDNAKTISDKSNMTFIVRGKLQNDKCNYMHLLLTV